MIEIIYDNNTQGGAKNIKEFWCDRNALTRFNFLKNDGDFVNIKMCKISLFEYLKKYVFKG